jgi:MFS superfamily sulfate permease-like transporter
MSLTGILLGLINIAINIAILVLIGLIIVWFMSWMKREVPEQIKNVYMIIVALIGLGMLIALLLGVRVGPSYIGSPQNQNHGPFQLAERGRVSA